MKRKISAILSILATICLSVGCGVGGTNSNSGNTDASTDSSFVSPDNSTDSTGSTESTPDGSSTGDSTADGSDSTVGSSDSTVDGSDTTEIPDDDSSGGGTPETPEIPDDAMKFTDFTAEEKALFTTYVGEVIPFIANNEYVIEAFDPDQPENYWEGIYFYSCGNTEQQFEEYRALFSAYTKETPVEDEGITWYIYTKGDIVVEMAHYEYEGELYTDVVAYNVTYISGDPADFTFTDFTAEEKEILLTYVGEVIPFLPNYEYYVEGIADTNDFTEGVCITTYENTPAEFTAYLQAYETNGYTLSDTYSNTSGNVWYVYKKGTLTVELCGYFFRLGKQNIYTVDIYASDSFKSSVSTESVPTGNLLTNNGKGLPTSASGVYNVDFTKAAYSKKATDQGWYLNGCPTVGNVKVLVIPVEFSDVTAESKGYSIANIQTVFNSNDANDKFYSVKEFFATSSYGQISLDFTVLDEWFRPEKESSYYRDMKLDNGGVMMELGEQLVIDEALAYYSQTMDLSDYDSDGNGTIDAIVMINTMEVKSNPTFQWAFRYWNIYSDEKGNLFTYDGVYANDYVWAPYGFLHQSSNGDDFDLSNPLNSYAYAHEFSHVLGSEDYYDTSYTLSYSNRPLSGKDVMDNIYGDHNPYTKFHLGWITSSRLIVAEDKITVTLESFHASGDTIIIANNWDERLGAYQEYYVLMYYRHIGLNNGSRRYFNQEGIVMYHVNASLVEQKFGNVTTYDVYNNNTYENGNDGYGTKENLIELVKNSKGQQIFVVGDTTSSNTVDDYGNKLSYSFIVDSLEENTATLTFTKNA